MMRSKIIMALALSTVSSVALAQTTAPKSNTPATSMSDKASAGASTSADTMNNKKSMNKKSVDNKTMDKSAMDKNAMDGTTANDQSASSGSDTKAGSAQAESSMGLKVADTATVAVRYVTVSPADFTASRLMGATVYNNQKETVGEIEDLVVDNGQKISGVIVSVGGFLGMGESYVVLDPSSIVLNKKDGDWRAFVDTSKESLKGAPKFKYPESKS